MFRLLQVLTFFVFLSCDSGKKKIEQKKESARFFFETGNTRNDKLHNGKWLFDNTDSMMFMHHREVVGSDTISEGFITCYAFDDSCKYFYLLKGENIYLLNKTNYERSFNSLGRFFKDFGEYFMISFDRGNDIPTAYQLFEKSNGKNVLGVGIEANGYTIYRGDLFLLYVSPQNNKAPDSLKLFNASTRGETSYKLPDSIPEYLDIEFEKLTEKSLKVQYSSFVGNKGYKTKTYSR